MNTRFKIRVFGPAILLIAGLSRQATGDQDWQERRLLEPSQSQARLEQQGRIVIYDGLYEDMVDDALDTQFQRIQNMMFIRVRHTTADGHEYADDDC